MACIWAAMYYGDIATLKKSLVFGSAMCMLIPVGLNACSSSYSARRVEFHIKSPDGQSIMTFIVEDLKIGPAEAPPSGGLEFKCSGSAEGISFDLFCDSEGNQWLQDSDGDIHPNNGDEIPCTPVFANIGENPIFSEQDIYFSFDEDLDTAEIQFLYPSNATGNYIHASQMPFNTVESSIQLLESLTNQRFLADFTQN